MEQDRHDSEFAFDIKDFMVSSPLVYSVKFMSAILLF